MQADLGIPYSSQHTGARRMDVFRPLDEVNGAAVFYVHIADKRIRRGVFKSARQLIAAIMDYIAEHNEDPQAFTWTAKAEDILGKARRARATLDKIRTE
jgi:hypothetical protein